MNTIQHQNPNAGNAATPETSQIPERFFDTRPITALLAWVKSVFDYLGGSREEAPAGMPFLASPLWLGIWWGLMIGLILLFCGQTSKFIYIDF
ncbi:MAG TPA: hypothetical protein VG938_06590 [Verrucomicrobiae bacterium]|jgi:hypothetical protein|nr:hypothetical protein [Verrucomicrobiae bacterium]